MPPFSRLPRCVTFSRETRHDFDISKTPRHPVPHSPSSTPLRACERSPWPPHRPFRVCNHLCKGTRPECGVGPASEPMLTCGDVALTKLGRACPLPPFTPHLRATWPSSSSPMASSLVLASRTPVSLLYKPVSHKLFLQPSRGIKVACETIRWYRVDLPPRALVEYHSMRLPTASDDKACSHRQLVAAGRCAWLRSSWSARAFNK